MFDWVREANGSTSPVGDADLREMLAVLGFERLAPLGSAQDLASSDPQAIDLLAQRERARERRDFSEADRLRAELLARGYEIRDGPQGSELIPAQGR